MHLILTTLLSEPTRTVEAEQEMAETIVAVKGFMVRHEGSIVLL